MATEKNFENRIKGFLDGKGAWFLKYWGGGQYTKSGIPDILACVNGKFVAIEVKAPTGKPSQLQLYNLREIEKAGGYAFLLYPKQWENFKHFIDLLYGDFSDAIQANGMYDSIKGW